MTREETLAGMVLAGGRSRRLGQDKVLLRYDGATLLARAVGLLRCFCDKVVVSGRDPAKPDAQGITPGVEARWLPDAVQGIGPMGGIMAGLATLRLPLLVIACDLPLLDKPTLTRLLAFRDQRPPGAVMTTFLQQKTGFIESLVAVYEPEALAYLEASREAGVYKLSSAVPRELRHELTYAPEEGRPFFNINRPQDMEALARLVPLAIPGDVPGQGEDEGDSSREARCS